MRQTRARFPKSLQRGAQTSAPLPDQAHTMRIALLGGSFNPPHIGHLLNACYVLGAHRVDAVWLMPVFRHAFDKRLAPFDARVAMCERAIAPFGDRLAVTRLEAEAPPGCFTVDLLEWLLPRHPDDQFSLVIGSDILRERHKWKSFDRIERMVDIIVVPRAGYPMEKNDLGEATRQKSNACAPTTDQSLFLPEVSSSQIRDLIARGQNPGSLLPKGVYEYIMENSIY